MIDHLGAACSFDTPEMSAPEFGIGFAGIDSGLKGYTALIVPGPRPVIRLEKTPIFGTAAKPTGYDRARMLKLAYSWRGLVGLVFIEKARGYRENGHEGNFKTGLGYGLWLMALQAAEIPVEELYPQQWKARLGILPPKAAAGELKKLTEGLDADAANKILKKRRSKRRNTSKDLSRQKTAMLFPHIDLLRTSRCQVPDDNLCEALLLAEMARRLYAGV